MTANNTQLEAARAAIETIQAKPDHIWLSDEGEPLRPGQVWTVTGGCGAQPSWFWLLLEPIDESTGNFAPLAIWTDLAGPDDLLAKLDRQTTGLVSFELEASLGNSALGECLGRLPDKLMDYIFAGREAVDDDALRAEFGWGLAYFNTRGPRLIWHEAIAERIEALQAPVRETVYGGDVALAFPGVPWSVFRRRFELCSMPLAADDGGEYTPCLLERWPADDDTLAESAPPAVVWAKCLNAFQPMQPGAEFCNEWEVRTSTAGEAVGALVYLKDHDQVVGNAMVGVEPGGFRVTLSDIALAPEEPPITDAKNLRLVVLLAE